MTQDFILVAFLLAMTKYTSDLRKEKFTLAHRARGAACHGGEARQENKAAGDMSATCRKQKEVSAGVQPIFSFVFILGPQLTGRCGPHVGLGFFFLANALWEGP